MTRLVLFISLLLSSITLFAQLDIERVEPPFWWTEMKNPQLQIMIYGKNLSGSSVTTTTEGIEITQVRQVESPNYLFVDLNILPESKPGKIELLIKKGRKKEVLQYELKERSKKEIKSFDNSDVVYLLMPDRFSNGNEENDSTDDTAEEANRNIKDGRHGGDIQGIIDRLDYLKDLGVTSIWSTPLLEDNEPVCSYHTYACSNYYKIDSRYGTNADYKRLAEECQKRGMKLIMDMVPNHCGTAHWWMKDLPQKSWIHQFDEFTRSNFQIATWHDPYVAKTDKRKNQDGWFDYSMPDLNQENPLLLTYLKQNAIWWVEYAGLNGIRIDTYPYNNKWKAAEWVKAIRNEYPWINIVGECWQYRPAEIAYWQTGGNNPDGYDSQLPAIMDFYLFGQTEHAFNEDEQGWKDGLKRIYNSFVTDYLYPNPYNMFVFLENHDTQRFSTNVKMDVNKYKLGFTFLFTTRGIPQIYYGSEIMMGGDKRKGDDDIRYEFPGGWKGDQRNAFTKEGRTKVENDVFNYMQNLLQWRKKNPVIHTGKMCHFIPEDNVYVYFRYNDSKKVMVVLNNKATEKTIKTDRFKEMLEGFTSGYEITSGKKLNDLSQLTIPAKTGWVIELNKK
ncbi:alpha-amlyase [Prolixibacteraceae bacterium JC049]|nr:alpha-amlyase [Prolixibacteraceae bacterium JC049]